VGRRVGQRDKRNWMSKATTISQAKVDEVKHATMDKLCKISSNPSNNFTLTSLLMIQQNIQGVQPGHIPLTIHVDHRQADNPYESHYEDN